MWSVGVCSVPQVYPPTWANSCLANVEQTWRAIYAAGGPVPYSRPGYEYVGVPPWREMPANGKRFQRVASIALPAVEGVETPVLQLQVPAGWEGILLTLTNMFTGMGFAEASGDIVWRVSFDWQWFKNLEAITISLGRLDNPYELEGGGYRLYENQTLGYTATIGAGGLGRLDPNGRILCAFSGWTYPKF